MNYKINCKLKTIYLLFKYIILNQIIKSTPPLDFIFLSSSELKTKMETSSYEMEQ